MKITFLYCIGLTMYFTGSLPYGMLKSNRFRYSLYRNVSHTFYVSVLMLLYAEIPYIWNDKQKVIESSNLLITYTVLIVKMYICRKTHFANLICGMVASEKKITSSGNSGILDIYNKCVKRGKYIQLYNMFVNFVAGTVYLTPFAVEVFREYEGNGERKVPYYMWMPFNKSEHYATVVAMGSYLGIATGVYYFTFPGLIIMLLLYVNFRLQVLGYLLRNIKIYANLVAGNEEGGDNEGTETVIRFCVLEHLKIIQITSTLNCCLKRVTLLEFVLLSAQIAFILLEGFTTESLNIILASALHILVILVQMLLFYWLADEIRYESLAISEALYETDWYRYNTSINKTIQIMMVRSQKPLSLSVGPFGDMSLVMALKILKGAYTYVTFLQHSYGHKS